MFCVYWVSSYYAVPAFAVLNSAVQSQKTLFAYFTRITRPLGYERVYLPLCKVADTPFHIQDDKLLLHIKFTLGTSSQRVATFKWLNTNTNTKMYFQTLYPVSPGAQVINNNIGGNVDVPGHHITW